MLVLVVDEVVTYDQPSCDLHGLDIYVAFLFGYYFSMGTYVCVYVCVCVFLFSFLFFSSFMPWSKPLSTLPISTSVFSRGYKAQTQLKRSREACKVKPSRGLTLPRYSIFFPKITVFFRVSRTRFSFRLFFQSTQSCQGHIKLIKQFIFFLKSHYLG